jgi:hypothetical protein
MIVEPRSSVFLACIGVLLVFVIILGVLLLARYLIYREKAAQAKESLAEPVKSKDGKDTLRWGIVITALGLALCIGLYPIGAQFTDIYPLGFGPWMLLGLVPLFFGLALILIYILTEKR